MAAVRKPLPVPMTSTRSIGVSASACSTLSFDARRQHPRARCGQGHLDIGIGEAPVLGRHEVLARHAAEEVEHVLVEHVPRPYLLLHHVEAGGREVRAVRGGGRGVIER